MMPSGAERRQIAVRAPVLLCVLLLLAVNIGIAATLFAVEYSAYNGSIEGTFIAIPRLMAQHPGDWQWWPYWNGGLPFENVYLPFTHWTVAAFILLTHLSAARSFHIVTAAIYILSALPVFWMALELSRRLTASLIAALAYSCLSVSALLLPVVAADTGGAFSLRRLQVLVFWGESPHTTALALLPVAVVCFSRAVTLKERRWKLLAGLSAACLVLSNAFGIVMLPVTLLCWLVAFPARPWWKAALTFAAIGSVTCAWLSPWLSPGMLRAIRANSATTGGDFRYTAQSWLALALVTAGFLVLTLATGKGRVAPHLRFFALLGFVTTATVVAWYAWSVAIIPQPARYQLEMDLALLLCLVFTGAWLLERLPTRARQGLVVAVFAALMAQTVHAAIYARTLIRAADPTHLGEYKMARWLSRHHPGERAFVSGSGSYLFNVFSDNPQLMGGHNQHTVNTFLPIAAYTVYSGTNAGSRDVDYSIFWLQACGAHLITVPGPASSDAIKPFTHPHKFEGILPVVWREGDDSIYEVPTRSNSLAHVIPAAAMVSRTPIHGLDIGPVEPYVAALQDPRYPLATFLWKGRSEAEVRTTLTPGQVISVQITYDRGWEAWANGKRQPLSGDAIGQMLLKPGCTGPCTISLRYTGGWEHIATRVMSIGAMLLAIGFLWLRRPRQAQ